MSFPPFPKTAAYVVFGKGNTNKTMYFPDYAVKTLGGTMKESVSSKALRYLVYVFIAVAIGLGVVALGFMTNYYELFYNGTSEMYEFYKSVQALNKAVFNGAIAIIVMAFFMIGFDLNKKKHGPIGTVYSIVVAAYTMMTGMVIMRAVPYYRAIYTAFDFAEVENYTPTTLPLTLSQTFYGLAMGLSVLIALLAVLRYVQTLKNREVASHE